MYNFVSHFQVLPNYFTHILYQNHSLSYYVFLNIFKSTEHF